MSHVKSRWKKWPISAVPRSQGVNWSTRYHLNFFPTWFLPFWSLVYPNKVVCRGKKWSSQTAINPLAPGDLIWGSLGVLEHLTMLTTNMKRQKYKTGCVFRYSSGLECSNVISSIWGEMWLTGVKDVEHRMLQNDGRIGLLNRRWQHGRSSWQGSRRELKICQMKENWKVGGPKCGDGASQMHRLAATGTWSSNCRLPSQWFCYIPELPPFSFTTNWNVRIKQKPVFRSKFSPLSINVVEIGSPSLGRRTDGHQYVTCDIEVKEMAYFCSAPVSGG